MEEALRKNHHVLASRKALIGLGERPQSHQHRAGLKRRVAPQEFHQGSQLDLLHLDLRGLCPRPGPPATRTVSGRGGSRADAKR